MEEHLIRDLDIASDVMREFLGNCEPVCAIVLGSGLGPYAETLTHIRALNYVDVPGMACSTAMNHVGRFVLGQVGACEDAPWVLCMQGRLHRYEGLSPQRVAFPIWLMNACGVEVILTTNAVGAINEEFDVGDFCLISDHINFLGGNPLAGLEPNFIASRFVPMNHAYDEDLQELLREAACERDIVLREGVYIAVPGPSFETPAEIRAFGHLGADTVAMSLVDEVIAARHVGMRVVGMSLVSNMAAGVKGAVPSDVEVFEVAQSREELFYVLADAFVCGVAQGR